MGKKIEGMKKGVRWGLFLWRAFTVILLSGILVPLFLTQSDKNGFYTWWILPSILIYLTLTYIQLRLKKGRVKMHLETMATRLFLGMTALAAAFITYMLNVPLWMNTFLVMAGILYAMAIQKIFFLRVIGL